MAAFVGLAERGPFNTPTLVTNWSQFTNTFGGFVAGSFLALEVYGFINNGGGIAFVVRIGQDGPADDDGVSSRARELPSAPQGQLGDLRVVALDPAAQPGEITVEVADVGGESPSEDMFKLLIKQRGQVVEEFDRTTLKRGKQNVATVVNAASKLVRIDEASTSSGVLDKPMTG